jgi:hypothetical protein
MSTYLNHAIVVTSRFAAVIAEAHKRCCELVEANPDHLGRPAFAITPLTPLGRNGVRSFMVAPDGSKEGWSESDLGDTLRKQIATILHEFTAYLDWVEVEFEDPRHGQKELMQPYCKITNARGYYTENEQGDAVHVPYTAEGIFGDHLPEEVEVED